MEITAFRSPTRRKMNPPMNEDLKKGDIILIVLDPGGAKSSSSTGSSMHHQDN